MLKLFITYGSIAAQIIHCSLVSILLQSVWNGVKHRWKVWQ